MPIEKPEVERAVSDTPGTRILEPGADAPQWTVLLEKGGQEVGCLWLENGELWAKTPGTDALQLMIDLADRLGARVRGDEFETYRSVDDSYFDSSDRAEKEQQERASAELLKVESRHQSRIRLFVVLFFAALGAVAFLIGKMFEK